MIAKIAMPRWKSEYIYIYKYNHYNGDADPLHSATLQWQTLHHPIFKWAAGNKNQLSFSVLFVGLHAPLIILGKVK